MTTLLAQATTFSPALAPSAVEMAGPVGQFFAWLLAILLVAAALGLIFAKELVHAALCLLFVMIGVAAEYAALGAPFVFVVQIVVYAGAVMVMILFIVMMIGPKATARDDDPLPGQRTGAVIVSVCLAGIMVASVVMTSWSTPRGLAEANAVADGNIASLGAMIFNKYVIGFEVLSALLIVAAVGAMMILFRVRPLPRSSQRELSRARFATYRNQGIDVGAMAGSGVYATSNAMDTPALLPDGSPLDYTVAETLYEAHEVHDAEQNVAKTRHTYEVFDAQRGDDE
ncbi:MAG: NADH-quinone oxidoreductase subunit J [Corynebacterium sp.]|nr:NADH-quinone oxidoreductase subunit J [Corynebacterium sp.]